MAAMATRILAVLNQKGGVGKTTTCVNLGAALALRGKRVLLVDMDPQANLTVHLGADLRNLERTTYSLLLGKHALGPAVLPTGVERLRYVPSTLGLANAEIQLASAVGRELLLREAIEGWLEEEGTGEPSPRADFVLIDCPPSLGILTMNALCAANEVLLPIQAEFFALQGIAGILESLRAVQRLNRGLRLSMVLPCMVDRRKTLARDVLDEVDKYFGNLVTRVRIRNNVKLAEAPSHGQTIFEYDRHSNGAHDYAALAAEVLGDPVPDAAEPAAEAAEASAVGTPPSTESAPESESAPPAPPASEAPTRPAVPEGQDPAARQTAPPATPDPADPADAADPATLADGRPLAGDSAGSDAVVRPF